jgi:CRP-like cAMP-binding protein
MATPSPENARLIRQLESTSELSAEDRAAIMGLPLRIRTISEKRDIIREGSQPTESCLILEGIACRYRMLSNGRRQILSFHFPGDIPDLHSLHLKVMDHSLFSVAPVRAAFIPHDAVRHIKREHSGVGDALDRHSMIDAAIYREWICNLGRRTAMERVANLICECFVRMQAVGLANQEDFELPFTQTEMGDATGLSNVHVNRTMKELRRLELIRSNGKMHGITNWEKLQEVGDFDPAYLQLRPSPASAA